MKKKTHLFHAMYHLIRYQKHNEIKTAPIFQIYLVKQFEIKTDKRTSDFLLLVH